MLCCHDGLLRIACLLRGVLTLGILTLRVLTLRVLALCVLALRIFTFGVLAFCILPLLVLTLLLVPSGSQALFPMRRPFSQIGQVWFSHCKAFFKKKYPPGWKSHSGAPRVSI